MVYKWTKLKVYTGEWKKTGDVEMKIIHCLLTKWYSKSKNENVFAVTEQEDRHF